METVNKIYKLKDIHEVRSLFGRYDENLKLIRNQLGVNIVARGQEMKVSGDKETIEKFDVLIKGLLELSGKGIIIRKHEVSYAITTLKQKGVLEISNIYLDKIEVSSKRQYITPKTKSQKTYVDTIRKDDIVFGIGPAGTGKTYLAMALAISYLKNQLVSRIILTRPAVEAGESLGYLPGDLYEKVTPYLRPIYDALYDMMEVDKIQRYIERGIIEVAPLAYMRGRTLNDAFIILDEAQNSTSEQMKMFLTRLGFDSKTVITGDITQSDLPSGKPSGLIQVVNILKDIKGIKFVYFTGEDVVRHELVQEIVRAYEEYEKNKNSS